MIPEKASVERVRATFGDRSDLTGLAVFRVVPHAVHANFAYGFGGRESIRERRVRGGVLCRDAVHGCFGLRGDAALNGKLYVSARFVSGIWLNTREDLDKSERTGAVVTSIVRGQVGDSLRVDAG